MRQKRSRTFLGRGVDGDGGGIGGGGEGLGENGNIKSSAVCFNLFLHILPNVPQQSSILQPHRRIGEGGIKFSVCSSHTSFLFYPPFTLYTHLVFPIHCRQGFFFYEGFIPSLQMMAVT